MAVLRKNFRAYADLIDHVSVCRAKSFIQKMIQSELNTIYFSGALEFDCLRRACAVIHKLKIQGYSSITLDMRAVETAFPLVMVPLGALSRRSLHEGIDVDLTLPDEPKLARLFMNANWAHLIDPRSYKEVEYRNGDHLPAFLFSSADGHFRAVESIMELLVHSITNLNRDQFAPIEWSINEITDNVLNHSESPIGGIVSVNVNKRKKFVDIHVCDAGVTIPQSLRAAYQDLTSDTYALDRAIREGVTKNNQTNMGNGLYGSHRVAILSGGLFSVYSRYARMISTPKRGIDIKRDTVPFNGTHVMCRINFENEKILSEALEFRGKKYNPQYTYIDKITEEEKFIFKVSDETKYFGSRIAARPILAKLINLTKNFDAKVVVDIGDVALVSSSFADEVFGKLFAELGPLEFMARVEIKGGNKVVRQLIDRAISQRMLLQAH